MNGKATDRRAGVRLNRWLAGCGYGSRRVADAAIIAGRVRINGQVAEPGMLVGTRDRVSLDGRVIHAPPRKSAPMGFVYHKPTGVICSERDNSARPLARVCALEALKKTLAAQKPAHQKNQSQQQIRAQRWMMVGRLDVNSSGLLLFVNDGDLCHALMHPSTQISRLYRVRVSGRLTARDEKRLLNGTSLDGGHARFESIRLLPAKTQSQGLNHWYMVELRQGMYREIRRLFAHLGYRVSRLVRVRYANISLSGLDCDEARLLSPRHLDTLMKTTQTQNQQKFLPRPASRMSGQSKTPKAPKNNKP